jgi:hypothetical protein
VLLAVHGQEGEADSAFLVQVAWIHTRVCYPDHVQVFLVQVDRLVFEPFFSPGWNEEGGLLDKEALKQNTNL